MPQASSKNSAAHPQTKTERSYSNQSRKEVPTSHDYEKNLELNHPTKKSDKTSEA